MLSNMIQQIVLERETEATLESIDHRQGVSPQRIGAVVNQASELINRVEMDLLVTRRMNEQCARRARWSPWGRID